MIDKINKPLKQNIPTSNIFPHLVNKAAFIDTIILNANGKLSRNYEHQLSSINNVGILGPSSLYSRCVFATWPVTGNPITLNYGRIKHFKSVPPLRFKFRSEEIPLTGTQVGLLISRLTTHFPVTTVSSLELTFDLSGVEFQWVRKILLHRAHRTHFCRDAAGRQTLYVGSAKSSWQARIYQKTESILRLEFILRRPFLKKHNINKPEDIVLLRRLNIWRSLSFRRFSRSRAMQVTQKWEGQTARNLLINWDRYGRPRDRLLRMLRINRIDPKLVLRKTRLQRTLEQMQSQLLW